MTKRSIFRRRNRSTVPADRSSRGRDGKGGGSVGRSRVSTGKRANLETLEKRELLAFDLVSISADVAQQFDLTPGAVNELQSPPRELTFRFDGNAVVDPASLASGIIITPAGGDGAFDGSEIPITPGFIGLGATDRIVVARFSGDLPDDLYRVTVSADPITGVRATDGDVLSEQFDVLVDLNLGPRVVAVVPQPIEGTVGSRQQLVNTIEVYFNDDPLSSVAAGPINSGSSTLPVVTPENYRLFLTQQTIENTDDVVSTPDSVSYDPVSNLATLTFANGVLTEGGLFRLRIGSGEAVAAPGDRGPAVIAAIEQGPSGTNDVFFNAQRAINANSVDEGAFNIADGLQSVVFQGGEIRNSGAFVLQWPGAFENPGIREQRREANQTRPFDTIDGINIYSYNFAELYGLDAQGELLDNAITEAQKQRVREALDLYEEHLGVRFVETEDSGLQIVNGDLRGLQQTADVSAGDGTPRSIFRINERDPSRGVLVLDSSENFFDASFGLSPDSRPSFFVEAVRGIGNVIGIGDFFELPTGVDGAVGSQDEPNSETFSNDGDGTNFSAIGVRGTPTPTGEPDFLSHAARVIGQAVNRPESSDIDFYEFSVVRPVGETGVGTVGEVVIETYAQRLDDSSLLDSVLQLYQVTGTPGNETFTLVSQNDDSFGDDSLIRLSLEEGRYIVGVSSVGNDEYFGELEGSGNGGRSEGRYDLRVTFTPSVGIGGGTLSGLSDTDGSLLDGDADGVAGGNFNFFFRTTAENAAAVADRQSRTIFVSKDADGSAVGNGSVNQPLDTIEAALDLAEPDDIVRLLPSLGADGDLDTLDDNNAYEIGFGGPNNQQLDDGASLEVPAGVTVVIDAGAIVKLRDAKIVVGSESTTDDRSESALQILGTPDNSVILTSFNETTLGNSTNTLNVTPQPGDWAGIEFRDDVDAAEAFGTFADEGIFLDYISNADIRFGGGSVTATAPAVAPIQLANSRPTIINNTISNSAGPAISADPNSFREDLFNSPRFQQRLNVPGSTNNEYQFTSDYNRVGPEIYGNALFNNSVNGLFVRVDTPIAGQTETLTVPGRFDDTDITHVIAETLVISGNPGGPTLLENRPNIGGVSSTAINGVGGEIPAGTYEYRLSFVTEDGQESLLSLATRTVTVNGSQAVQLTGLPVAPAEFAGRLLYRGLVGGSDFELVDTLNATSTQFLDTLSNQDIRGGLPRQSVITSFNATTVTVAPVAGAGTFPLGNTFDYRFTFADPFGGETQASGPTLTAVAPQDGAFQLANIPVAPDGFVGTNVFRLNPITGDYILVAELRNGQTEFLDAGFVPQVDLTGGANASILGRVLGSDINGGTRLLPRFDARLTVDPGIIVKLNAARIEASFGADFYAEGTPERPIFFTSINDDTVGTTLSFDVSNNGETTGSAGDFGGISIRNQSTGSFDHVNIRFAGGEVPLSGGLRDVNALEIIQSEVRVTNSVFENNDDGFGVANADDPRFGLGFNSPATIFVRGAQPIIVGNTITNDASSISSGAAISINPNALTSESVVDRGRLTGPSERLFINLDNQGPLLENNLIGNHRINGLEVRGEVVTVDSVFDDTDITHVVEDPIVSVTNAFGGAIRLRSSSDESLVVKFGQDGTLVASGRPLDIEDRIGGTLQVLGTNSFPVVLTSLNDDSIGSGNTPIGLPSNDTLGVEVLGADGEPVQPGAGDWIGLQILAYANDRNVTYQYETETAQPGDINANGTPQVAEGLGTLARGEGSGDENTRLGFTLRGTLATPDDVDTYEFDASGQTLVTIDIDETDLGLDTVVELVTLEGEVIARSDNSFAESVGREALFVDEAVGSGVLRSDVRPLLTSPGGSNVESPNDADAGFRVVLPGEPLSTSTFFVRVRTAQGISSGQYTLSIRLGNESEVAGSTVRRADIRFASTAILVTSTPTSSPLTTDAGEVVELIDPTPGDRNSGDERAVESVDTRLNANFAQAQPLGNLLTSDRGVLTVSGEIGNLDGSLTQGVQFESLIDERLEDVDVFRVDLFNQQIRPDVFDSENRFVTATFDIDFADQLGRPNTRLHIFDSAGRLILTGNDGSIADDVALPSGGIGTSSLTGGSQGTRDAFIGPVELLEGTYYVAVTSVATVPQVLDQFFEPNATAGDVRLRPIDSVRTLSFDSFEELIVTDPFSGTPIDIGVTRRLDELTAEAPLNEAAFDTNPDTGDEAITPFDLPDVSLFISYNQSIDGPDRASITQFNPFTGELIRVIGDHPNANNDIALRPDGEIYAFASSNAGGEPFNSATVGGFQNISTLDGSINRDSDDLIIFSSTNVAGTDLGIDTDVVFLAEALVFNQIIGESSINTQAITNQNAATAFVSGSRSDQGSGGEIPEILTRNIIYAFNSNSGEILSAGGSVFGSDLATADRNFDGAVPYNPEFGPASDEIEVGIVDVGQFELPEGAAVPNITGLGRSQQSQLSGQQVFVGVTDQGGIFEFDITVLEDAPENSLAFGYDRVIPSTSFGTLEPVAGHQPVDGVLAFSGVSYGPRAVEGGEFEDVLFGTTEDGWLYAFRLGIDADTGEPQAEIANVFFNGRGAVELTFLANGLPVNSAAQFGPTGLAFSNLVANPFHVTSDRFDDAGHGAVTTPNLSRQPLGIGGGNSLYFGFEVQGGNNPNNSNTVARPDNDPLGDISPGGAHGSVISDQFDLSEFSAGDEPTLYFTYHIEVEANDDFTSANNPQRDAFRVFGTDDSGQWQLLATNNSFRQLENPDEFDNFFETGIPVQEIFDDQANNGNFRQARIDLSPFAGSENVRIRFDFNTAGAARTQFGSIELVGVAGDNVVNNETTQLIDDAGNLIVLQSVVGQNLVFASNPADPFNQVTVADGDTITITDVDNIVSTLTYVDTPSLAPLAAGQFEAVLPPAGTLLTPITLARITAEALPVSLVPSVGANGSVNIANAATVVASDGLAAGSASPKFSVDTGTVNLDLPSSIEAVSGETLTITIDGVSQTFTFVPSPGAGDPPSAADEIEFDETLIDPVDQASSVQLEALNKINAAFGSSVVFLSGDSLGFAVPQELVTFASVGGPTEIVVTAVAPFSASLPDGRGHRTGETLTIDSGDIEVTVVLVRTGDDFVAEPGQLVVEFSEAETASIIGDRIATTLNTFRPEIMAVATADGFELQGVNALPIVLGDDPIFTSIERTEGFESYVVPLTVPSVVNDGDTLSYFLKNSPGQQVASQVTFVLGTPDDPATPIDVTDMTVVFDANDDADAIAQRIINELPFLRPQISDDSSRVVDFVTVSGFSTLGTEFVSFQPIVDTSTGLNVRAVPVIVDHSDSIAEVGAAIQVGLINSLGFLVNDPTGLGLDLDNFATRGNFNVDAESRIRVFGVTLLEEGSFGSSTFLPGDAFGVQPSNAFTRMQVDTESADNNVIEGVYIDDIVIGFAERGEVVLYNDYLGQAQNPNFVLDPAFIPDTRPEALQPENPDEVVVGPYRLEIRTGDEFGVPNDFDPINLVLSEDVGSGRSFDTNDRLSDGAVSLVLPEGADLLDGDSFVLDDGQATVTFEFNNALSLGDARDQIQLGNVAINFLPSDSNADIARRVRDAINSQLFELSSDGASSSGTLRIQAISGDGRLAGATTSGRVELFGENITVNPTLSASTVDSNGVLGSTNGRLIQIDGVAAETPFGNFSSRRIPLVDQDSRTVVSAQFRNITIDAFPTGYVPGDTLVVDGRIGDQVASGIPNNVSADDGAILGTNPIEDTDVYRIFLEAGTSIDLDVDAAGLFRDTSVLGLPVIFIYPQGFVPNIENNGAIPDGVGFSGLTPTAGQGETSLGANLTFVAQETGFYDVQVSSQFAFQNQFGLVPIGEDEIFDVGTGEYQLTIRPTNATGVPVRDVIQVDYQFGRTDTNRTIDQGQLIIEQNIIRDSAQFGIDLITERGLRATSTDGLFPILGQGGSIGGTQLDDLSVAGTPGLLRNQNTFGLVTGTVVVNNLIIDSPPEGDDIDTDNSTGIRLTGGSFDDGQSPGPNVFARLINNTIVGDGNGVGIEVDGRAAPTIANNVLVGLTDGIVADTVTASLTETTSNVIADVANPSTLPIGQSTFVLEESDGLFIGDASNGLFIPAANSPLIDSSAGSIDDREELFNTVKLAVGLSESPILAPQFDASGNQRVDTPGQGASGTGQNVFADRGALDNADAGGPMARLTTPLDLNAAVSASLVTAFGSDADPAPSIVRLVDDIAIPFIEIELSDFGVGVNDASVVSGAVILRENGVELEEGTDYLFGFSNSGSTIRLTSTRGEFARDATYEIELSQSIVDLAGNPLEATSAGDQTILTILTAGVSFDFGDAPSPFQVQSSNNGPSHANPGVDSPRLGSRVDAELDGANSLNSLGDDALAQVSIDATAAASISTGPLTGGSSLTFNSLPLAGETVDFILGSETFTIEFTDALSNPAVGNIAIDISSADIATIRANLATRIRAEIQSQAGSIEVTDATIDPTLAEGLITFLSFDDEDGVPIGRFQTPGGQSVLLFGNPDANGVLQAGDVQGVLVPGQTTFIVVNATVPEGQQAFLDGWIDFGLDGVFSRADQFAEGVELFDGENLISVSVPSNAGNGNAIGDLIADTVARFRISNTGFLDPTGVAIGGEVEDHQISLLTNNLGLPQNTAPSFDNTTTTIIVEEDATTALSVVQNVLPGSPTNQVENEQQSLLPPTVAIVPGGDPDNLLVGGSLLVQEVFQEDGTLDYDLVFETNPNVSGTVELVITISDNQVPPATTEVAITLVVAPVNDLPTFTLEGDLDPDMSGDPTISIDEGAGTVTVDVIAESSAGPGEVSDVTFQVRVVDADDVARFTVEPFFNENGDLVFELGDDEFTPANDPIELEIVAFDDENLPSQPQIITLFVTNVPDVPVANDDPGIGQPAFTTSEDDQLLITAATLLANDTDGDLPNDVLSVAFPNGQSEITTLRGATVRLVGSDVIYDPTGSAELQSLANAGESIVDTFEYLAVDSTNASGAATVSITVTGANDAPIAVNQSVGVQASGLTRVPLIVTDPDDDPATPDAQVDFNSVVITFQPSFGTVFYDPSTREFVYNTNSSLIGQDQFRFTIADQFGARSQEATIFVSTNPAPVAVSDQFGAVSGRELLVNIAANDTDNVAIDLSSIQIETAAGNGTVELVPGMPGFVRYVSDVGFSGTDSFTYTIADNEGARSLPATVTFVVQANALQNPDLDTGELLDGSGEFVNTDVNNDNVVSPIDALLVINALRAFNGFVNNPNSPNLDPRFSSLQPNENGVFTFDASQLTFSPGENIFFWDVDGNDLVQPLDALLVINRLRRDSVSSASEPESLVSSSLVASDADSSLEFTPIDTTSASVAAFQLESSVALAAEIEAFQSAQSIASFDGGQSSDSSDRVDDDLIDLVAAGIDQTTAPSSPLDRLLAEMDF